VFFVCWLPTHELPTAPLVAPGMRAWRPAPALAHPFVHVRHAFVHAVGWVAGWQGGWGAPACPRDQAVWVKGSSAKGKGRSLLPASPCVLRGVLCRLHALALVLAAFARLSNFGATPPTPPHPSSMGPCVCVHVGCLWVLRRVSSLGLQREAGGKGLGAARLLPTLTF
jgi:hypothetical protein